MADDPRLVAFQRAYDELMRAIDALERAQLEVARQVEALNRDEPIAPKVPVVMPRGPWRVH